MTPKLTALALSGVLQIVQIIAYSIVGNRQVGIKVATGPRDAHVELTGTADRVPRAMNTHFESLIMFTLAVVVVTLSGQSSPVTQSCAWVYLGAQILYIPADILGLAPWRSLLWTIGMGAAVLIMMASLL